MQDEKLIRSRKDVTILDAAKGGVRFHTRQLAKHNDDYLELRKKYEAIQDKTVSEILKVAGKKIFMLIFLVLINFVFSATYYDPLQRFSYSMATLDVYLAFAAVSRAYVRPVVLEKGI